jgi:hypothetical protein
MYCGIVTTGSTNDNIAIKMTDDLKKCINDLPICFFVGHAAYSLSENLLIPFTPGSQRGNLDHSFNVNKPILRRQLMNKYDQCC